MKKFLILTSIFMLCVGCNDIGARRQKAEQSRRQQSADELRELGEAMHNKQGRESAADPSATNASENNSNVSPDNGDSSE